MGNPTPHIAEGFGLMPILQKHAQQETPHFTLQHACPIGNPTPHIAEGFGLMPILQKHAQQETPHSTLQHA